MTCFALRVGRTQTGGTINLRGRKLFAVAGTVAALSLGVVACGDSGDSTSGGGEDVSDASFDMNVGVLVPQTGDLAIFAPPGEKAADLAVQQFSKALEGTDITVDSSVADTETKAAAAQSAAQKLISDGSTCLAGPWASDETVPVGTTVAARQQVPLISPSSTSPEITDLPDDGYVFRTAPSDALQGQVLADAVGQELGTDATISVAARNDAYGEGIANEFKSAFEDAGGTTTGPVLYDPEGTTFDSEASQIVEGNPDGYVIIDFEDPYSKVGAALVRTGDFDASMMFTADGLAFEPKIPSSIPAEALDGAHGTRPATPDNTETAKEFQKLYDSASGTKDRGTFDAQNFDAVSLCVLAAVAAGSSDGPAIQSKIQEVASAPGTKYDFTQLPEAIKALQSGEDIDFEGVSGPLDLDDNGDPTQGTYDTYQYKNGKFVLGDQVQKQSGE
jgi:branched-chain amino acid transport system substrate-binding protein